MAEAFLVLAVLLGVPSAPVDQARARCLVCHTLDAAGPSGLASRPPAAIGSAEDVHAEVGCAECHVNVAPGGAGMASGSQIEPRDDVERSMLALRGATGLHTLRGCQSCHQEQYDAWRGSVHGQGFGSNGGERGEHALYPAFCTDCHGAHGMRSHDDAESPTFAARIPDTCARCHQFSAVVSTYQSSVHGQKRSLTGLGRKLEVAVCTDCHGTHGILGPDDPDSLVGPIRKTAMCAECHEGATDRFAQAFSHTQTGDHWLLRLIRLLYILIIGGTLSGMGAFLAADVARIALTRGKHVPSVEDLATTFERWGPRVRVQHMTLVISFTLLSITGVPLMFPRSPIALRVMELFGGPMGAAVVHRIAAAALVVASAIHALWIVGEFRRGVRRSSMIPAPRDVRDMILLVLFTFGLRRERPTMGRYGPLEKFEYWSLVWGTFVMVATGLILWFPVAGAFAIGGIGIQAAQLIHALEALLAVLVILTWHMYHAHLCPESWPMSNVWLTGRISRWAMKELHPEELAEIEGRVAKPTAPEPAPETTEGGEPDAGDV